MSPEKLGQHFLTDASWLDRIAHAVRIDDGVWMEIGAGHGEMTTRLARRACKVFAIELDPRSVVVLQQIAPFNYRRLRRYADAKSAWDRLLAVTPDDVSAKAERAMVDLDWKGDTRPLHQMIDSIRATNPAALQSNAERWIICALVERDAVAANNALIASGMCSGCHCENGG